MTLTRYSAAASYLLATLFISASHITAALQSNAKGSPQEIFSGSDECSDVDRCVCGSRDPCEVQLDVPDACMDSNSMSLCPVVFFLHGAGGTITGFARNSGVHDAGVIGVYPQGVNGWNTGPKGTNTCDWDDYDCTTDPDEGKFILDIINEVRDLGAHGNVYVHGSSNGAALAYRLAANANEIPIKGIIAKITQMLEYPLRSGPGDLNYNQPEGHQRVSVLNIMGTDDGLIPYEGGSSAVFDGDTSFELYSALESNVFWAIQNNCRTEPIISKVQCDLCTDSVADFYEYPNCADGTIVEHYKVYGGTHANAGRAALGGRTESEVVFDFIERCETGVGPTAPTNPSPVSPVLVPTTPVASPVSAPTCVDDTSWRGKVSEDHDCAYVAQDPSVRCKWINIDNLAAYEGCPAACNSCNGDTTSAPIMRTTSSPVSPVPVPTTPVASPVSAPTCVDDTSWRGKVSEDHDCAYVAQDPSVRCKWINIDNLAAYEGCPAACNSCNGDTTSALVASTTSSPVSSPTSRCLNFCSTNTHEWDEKCRWQQYCSECADCF